MGCYRRLTLLGVALLILQTLVFCVFSVIANPIPIYPDPNMEFSGQSNVSMVPFYWIIFVFIIDFFIDILIVYAGILLLDRFDMIKNRNVLDFSKKTFIFSVAIISIVGLISELLFGSWIGGIILALFFIFLSFVFVSKYILKINWANSSRMGFFAIIINIIVWSIVFSI